MSARQLAVHIRENAHKLTLSQVDDLLAELFAAGERKGRIAGLREAGTLARQNGWHGAWHLADNEADRLERSEPATGKEGK